MFRTLSPVVKFYPLLPYLTFSLYIGSTVLETGNKRAERSKKRIDCLKPVEREVGDDIRGSHKEPVAAEPPLSSLAPSQDREKGEKRTDWG